LNHVHTDRTGSWGFATRESAQVASALLSAVDLTGPVDGVLLIKRTGVSLAAWARKPIAFDVIAVMTATLLGSVETIVQALGGPSPDSALVDVGGRRIFASKVDSQHALVLVSVRGVSDTFLRQEAQRLIAKIAAAKETEREKRGGKASQARPLRERTDR
jgi:predicted regulator of Ras-like GTPase activity (Roadblock/LC7/MglB family)